ncbi:hypothetical protein ACHWQZ_G006371 [Mnemiopsis leidyi]
MTKKFKPSSFPKQASVPSKKLVLTENVAKEIHLLGYILCFVTLHNVTLHNGHLHSVHKEAALFSVLALAYRPLLSAIKQGTQMRGLIKEALKVAVHTIFWGGTLYLLPALSTLVITPSTLSLTPVIVLTLLLKERPPSQVPVSPSKSSSPDEIRKYCEALLGNLKTRLQFVAVNILCYAYLACYLPFTFSQSNTVVKQMTCIKVHRITAIVHISVLLVIQVLPIDFIIKLTGAANMLGRWQSAVLSDQIHSLPEWKDSVEWEQESIVRWEDKTYLAISPSVTAHPSHYPHTILHVIFDKSFKILKILTLVEGVLVAVLFYQTH